MWERNRLLRDMAGPDPPVEEAPVYKRLRAERRETARRIAAQSIEWWDVPRPPDEPEPPPQGAGCSWFAAALWAVLWTVLGAFLLDSPVWALSIVLLVLGLAPLTVLTIRRLDKPDERE